MRNTSRAKMPSIISGSRRTCQMRNVRPGGGWRDKAMACLAVMPTTPLDIVLPQ